MRRKVIELVGKRYGCNTIQQADRNDYLFAYEPEDVTPLERHFTILGDVFLEQLFLHQNKPIFEGFNVVCGKLEDGTSFEKNMPDGLLMILLAKI